MTNLRRRRARGERGAVVVESAIVLPLFFAFVFGLMEVGGAIKSYSGASNAVRAGGRTASVMGNDAMADQQILLRISQEAAGIGKGEIDYIIIWNATGVGDSPPAGCITAAGTFSAPNITSVGVWDGGAADNIGACNVYIRPQAAGAAFDKAKGPLVNGHPPEYFFGCAGPSAGTPDKLDCNWAPQNRKVKISPRGTTVGALNPDYLGVYIHLRHQYYTGVFGQTLTVTDKGISLLEPDSFGVATP